MQKRAKRVIGFLGIGIGILAIALSLAVSRYQESGEIPPTTWQYHPSPEAAGYASDLDDRLDRYANSIPADEIMLVSGDKVLWEFGNTSRVEAVASVRKSVLAMLYGKYVDQGIIDLDMTLEDLGIDDVEGLLPIEKTATIEHLISARSGVYHPGGTYGDHRSSHGLSDAVNEFQGIEEVIRHRNRPVARLIALFEGSEGDGLR